ncbi:1-phosphofructokinase family hexose kinase [Actinomadura flavalba]|uniref:1-phosphofructokinase family hexose kinase n=1 Tax=Actinomadura flavalba TaxID=1120938 RepID=UPI001F0B2E7D|nr:hexose kinase [Actinomadura flavalba]
MTLNAALDVTYTLPRVAWGEVNRVASVAERAGGKGVNAARVAASLGSAVLVTGFAGGATGGRIRADLDAAGLPHDFVPVRGESRRTMTVVDGTATVFNEPGPVVTGAEWSAFTGRFARLAADAEIVVLAGSLPPGVPPDALALLTRATGRPVVLDADGDALRRGVGGRPAVVKPNAEELRRATGEAAPLDGARRLLDAGCGAVVVSLGADGVLAVTPEGTWRAAPPAPVPGNPTGAGDAAVAAMARSLARGDAWPELLRHAVALSAAAVASPVAGDADLDLYARLLPQIRVQGDPCPS